MERWPAAYDADDLRSLIESVRDRNSHPNFFDLSPTVARRCQGDILTLDSEIPIVDRDGVPATTSHASGLWLLVGNTCDFERDVDDLLWTQIIPIIPIGGDSDIDSDLLQDFRMYRTSRHFYLPDWTGGRPESHHIAEFPMPVTVDKRAILAANVRARLSRSAWILLNACFVRFLARDDGRFVA